MKRAVGIDDKGDVDEARPSRYIGEVGYPELIGSLGCEVALNQIGRSGRHLISDGGALLFAPSYAFEAHITHQPLDDAPGDRYSLALQLTPDLAGAVDAEVGGMDTGDLNFEFLVSYGTGRWRPLFYFIVGRRGNRQVTADRLAPKRSLCSSTNVVISSVGGRAPPRKKPPRSLGARWPS